MFNEIMEHILKLLFDFKICFSFVTKVHLISGKNAVKFIKKINEGFMLKLIVILQLIF